ncbi:hypothetical protein LUZ61_012509 [Rhynchospora tenuis]|uniref:DUF1664 domain-containing protein n=1 Tax=Rhynchospora tenuis TaxID=198213 RepID=A0AAD6F1C1_9POAL|nr:hypothetical protein LUZ61_012509 [Rhynchospora tenuis]
MALGKLALAVSAAIIGSTIANEGGVPGIKDLFSGAFKILKYVQHDKESPKSSSSKPRTDSLLDQVNNLRQELQQLASSRSVTIVTTSSGGGGVTFNRVTAIVVVGAVGYLYIRWKGWKITDMMFVTRRGLADASAAVGKQLEQVQSSIAAAKKFLATRIDRVDCRLDECKEITESTRDEVKVLNGDITAFQEEMQSVHRVVQTLETKLGRLENSQDLTTRGISELCKFASRLEQDRNPEMLSGGSASSSRPALESSKSFPVNRAGSLLPIAIEPPSPTTSGETSTPVPTPKIHRSTTVSETFLKELKGVSNTVGPTFSRSNSVKPGLIDISNGSSGSPQSNGSSGSSQSAELSNGNSSGSSRFGIRLPGISVFNRNRSPAN